MENISGARTFFIAPNGNDDNAGDINAPLATIQKAHELVEAGDTIYLRGGTYTPPKDQTAELTKSGTKDKPIRLFAYGNEKPVIDGSGWTRQPVATDNKTLVRQTGDYWHIKGIEMFGSPRYALTAKSVKGSIFEDLNLHDNDLTGLGLAGDGTENNLILGGDFHGNYDPLKKGQDADGIELAFGSGKGNVIRGVRVYNNSDDGIDLWEFKDAVTIEDTWAFGNGVDRWNVGDEFVGNGNGFKLSGGSASDLSGLAHVVRNSVAWGNTTRGFDYNSSAGKMEIYNNISYDNGDVGFAFTEGTHKLRNNVAVNDGVRIKGAIDDANNSWTLGVTVDGSDFLSLDPSQAEGARPSTGALPETDFLKLKAGSDLIDAGINVGEPFEGSAPDLGAFESGMEPAIDPVADPVTDPVTDPITEPGIEPKTPENLVAQYNFDNMIGDVVKDDSFGGRDNSGQLYGATREEGPRGRHIVLDGNDKVAIPNSEDINLGLQKQRSVSLWFRVDDKSVDTRKQVLYEEGAGIRGLNAYVFDDKLYVGGWNEPASESNWEGTWLSTDKLEAKKWHHLAFTLDGNTAVTDDALKGYLDGEFFGAGKGSQLWGHSGGIGLGGVHQGTQFHDGSQLSGTQALSGALDNVSIFNSTLSADDIQALAAA